MGRFPITAVVGLGALACLLAAMPLLTAAGISKPLGHDEMRCVVGGVCDICYNFCSGGGCAGSLCEGKCDAGEYCGSSEKTGTAWGCLALSGTSQNCKPTGGNASCKAKGCHCTEQAGQCNADSSQTSYSGQIECTD
jgi:hypothetical protein